MTGGDAHPPGRRARLRSKLVLLSALITLATAAVMSAMAYSEMRRTAYAAAYDKLRFAARFHAQQLSEVIERTRLDARILAEMPPISGIIRTGRNPAGRDPLDGSTLDQWRTRLEAIFSESLKTHPYYTQVRFIGREDGWREIVRVDTLRGGVSAVPRSQLQAKGQEPYIAQFTTMAQGIGRFSEVTYNRENGRISGPPTLRFVQPVLDEQGALFGALVVNVDFAGLLSQAAVLLDKGLSVDAVTDAGDYMRLGDGGDAGILRFHRDADYAAPPFADVLGENPAPGEVVESGGNVLFVDRLVIDQGGGFGLSVITTMPRDILLADARAALWRLLSVAVGLVLVSALVATVIGARLTQPIQRLAEAVRRHRRDQPLDLVVTSRDEVGEMTEAFIGLCNDILSETARSRAILEGAAEAIVTVTPEGMIDAANPAACRLFGRESDAFSGQSVALLDGHDTASGPSHAIAAHCAGTMVSECMARRGDGGEVPIDISISQSGMGSSARLIVIMRDISARRAADLRVERLIKALERSNAELDKFAYIASHDLKAPLRVIDNASRWLEEDLAAQIDDDSRENLDLIRTRVVRMERLLDDLLAHSRIGRTEENSAVVTGLLLRETLRDLVNLPPGIDLRFSARFDVIALPAMPITTVLLNLIGNAIKHHDRARGEVRVDAAEVPGGFEFVVEDDGPGIPQEYRAKVFEMFQTLKPRDQVDGSGMGLAMVQKYVDYAGGRITLEDATGRGAAFRVFWPIARETTDTGIKAA